MLDWETFLTTLYVMADDFCQRQPPDRHPGRSAALSRSETLTLALLARWRHFDGERDFYRWAERHLRGAFPHLPNRTQYNRQVRRQQRLLEAFTLHLSRLLEARHAPFEALDRVGVPLRNRKRRGRGWLPGQADFGFSNRLGKFFGFAVLLSVHPEGPVTGWGFGPGSAKDQSLAEVFFAARQQVGQGKPPCARNAARPGEPEVCLPTVGEPAEKVYLTDRGFQGPKTHRRWRDQYGAEVIAPPQGNQVPVKHPWPQGLRQTLAGMRQIVETVLGRLEHDFALEAERPHTLTGFAARLAARLALFNFCIWLNRKLGRPNMAFADLIAW